MGNALDDVFAAFHVGNGGSFIMCFMGIVAVCTGMTFDMGQSMCVTVVKSNAVQKFINCILVGCNSGGCIGSMVTGLGSGEH